MDRFVVGDPESMCAGLLSGGGVVRVHFFPNIKSKFFDTGFSSNETDGRFEEDALSAGYDRRIWGGEFYYVSVPWPLVALALGLASFLIIFPEIVGRGFRGRREKVEDTKPDNGVDAFF